MGALDGRGEAVAEDHDEKILVSVRLRPLNENEIARNDVSDWECINENTIIYKNVNLSVPERSMYPTAYTFDRVFSCDCSTRQVYEKAAKEVALSVVGGINSTVFAYGQTSSGKTYTMTGITEYTIADLYGYIRKHKEREFQLKFSAMEIYNESVRDLLAADSTPLRLLDDPERGTVVERLTETSVLDFNHVIELLSNCEVQRQIGETSLNETSSRSHQIIKLTIESSAREFLGRDNSSTLVASVNFVDLAGSERASQSMSAGARLKEGCHINRSLLTLGTVIRKLSMGRNGHIPFRDSKLTRILQSSLGGNARTAIICTMSPARSYIEQSRNTLLFASCAKEVTNNAQVNVVMSDRALIKHLQREVARLENELRSPRSNFVTSNFAALLQEKDLKIDKLEKEKNYLALQCDVIQSHVQDLLNMIPNSGNLLIKVGSGHHSNSQVKELSECKNSVPIVPRPLGIAAKSFDMSLCLDAHIRNNSDGHNVHIPNFKENLLNNSTSPMPLTNASRFSDNYSCQGWEEIDEQSTQTSEDLCKEVRCIKTQENNGIPAPVTAASVYRVDQESIFHRYREDMKPLSPVLKEDKGFTSLTLKKDKEPVLLTSEEDGETMSHLLGSVDLSSIHSSRHDLATKVSRFRGSKLRRSRSCKESLISASYSPWFEKIESIENTPPTEFETHFFSGRHKDFERRFSALRYGASDKGLLKKVSPMGSTFDIEVDAQNVNTSKDENISNSIIKTSIATSKEITGLQHDKHGVDRPVMESEAAKFEPIKSIKDIGLDPMEDDSRSHSNWPYEFKKLQGEIIELWCMCNVSLVHRTYFFMLFNGDPTDSIYMEVELRRLSFLRETFSHGNQTMENDRILTRASSLKALQHERLRLTKQMKKRLSEQDRESLYLKWGIQLNSKNRRLQLAHCLWTNTEDIDHITDSAIVVANLVGFIEPGQASKEMFGLNFVPRYRRRSYSLIRSFKTLLSRDTEDLNLALIP